MTFVTRKNTPRIAEIEKQIEKLTEELDFLTHPEIDEILTIYDDMQLNPEVYTSYLTDEHGDGDRLWLCRWVLDNRETAEEEGMENA